MSEIHAHPAGEWPCLGAVDTGNPALVLLQSLPSFPEPVTTLSNLDHNVLESDCQDGRPRMVIYGGLSSRVTSFQMPLCSLQWQCATVPVLRGSAQAQVGLLWTHVHTGYSSAGKRSGQEISRFAALPGIMSQNTAFLPLKGKI